MFPYTRHLLSCVGGAVVVPADVWIDRRDGGHLCVWPSRAVWDRSALSDRQLIAWSQLVAATAAAMLEVLPQLRGGYLTYWDADDWAVHPAAHPTGPKQGRFHRRLHTHLIGRSPDAVDPDWAWGEAPRFPRHADRTRWMAGHQPLSATECDHLVDALSARLIERHGFSPGRLRREVAVPPMQDTAFEP